MQPTGRGPCRFNSSMMARTRRMMVSASTSVEDAPGSSGAFPDGSNELTMSGPTALSALQTGAAPAIIDISHKIGTKDRRIEFIAYPCYLTGYTTCLFPRTDGGGVALHARRARPDRLRQLRATLCNARGIASPWLPGLESAPFHAWCAASRVNSPVRSSLAHSTMTAMMAKPSNKCSVGTMLLKAKATMMSRSSDLS